MKNFLQYFKSVLSNMFPEQTITLYNKEKYPQGKIDYDKAHGGGQNGTPTPSAYQQAIEQRELPKEEIKLVPINQKNTEAIMDGATTAPKGTFGRSQKAKNLKPSDTVMDAINKAIQAHPVPQDLMYDISAQESVFDPSRRARDYGFDGVTIDPKTGKPYALSTAEGLFMFNEPTWNTVLNSYNDKPGMSLHLPNTNRLDPYSSAMAAAYLIQNGQLGKWDASRDVWGPSYQKEELQPNYSQSMDSYNSW